MVVQYADWLTAGDVEKDQLVPLGTGAIVRHGLTKIAVYREGAEWFVGTINNREARTLPVSLAFLPTGQRYLAHLYSDDAAVATRTHVAVATREVDSTTTLSVALQSTGGQAIWLSPAPR